MPLIFQFRRTGPGPRISLVSVSNAASDKAAARPDEENGQGKGPQALAALALGTQARLARGEKGPFVLEGGEDSAAHKLYRDRADVVRLAWPACLFGDNGAFRRAVQCRSATGRDGKAYRAWFEEDWLTSTPMQFVLDCEEVSHDAVRLEELLAGLCGQRQAGRAVRAALLLSGEVAYARDIEQGVRDGLRELKVSVSKLAVHVGPGGNPTFPANRDSWMIACRKLLEQGGAEGFDFLLPVGTQASVALRDYLGPEKFGLGGNKIIFLGVTYPVASRLIDSLYSRYETREVAGAAYGGDGLRSVAALIRNWLVPGCRMKFFYFPDFPQDAEGANELRRVRLYPEHLSVEEASPETLREVLACPDTLYFSWYTLEAVLASNDPALDALVPFLRTRKVVSSTRSNCASGATFAAVAAVDREIGRRGAELLHKRLTGEVPHLGRQDIFIPRVGYWLNQPIAEQLGVRLSPDVLTEAIEVFHAVGVDQAQTGPPVGCLLPCA